MRQQPPLNLLLALLLGALALIMLFSLTAGSYSISASQIWQALVTGPGSPAANSNIDVIIWQVRMPRLLGALLLGISLSAAGAVFQSLLRNPLVSPDILGVSAGSGLGAIVAMLLGLSLFGLQLSAFIGGLCAVALVYLLAGMLRQRDPILMLVLAGIAVGTVLGACISLLKVLADPYDQLPAITYWLLGGLNSVSLTELSWAAPTILLPLALIYAMRWRLNLLSLPDEQVQAMGVNVHASRWLLIAAATLLTASAVSFAGIVGWVGLLIPHAARLLTGANLQRLLPVCILLGACFVLLADSLSRSLGNSELPLGVLTALVGGPIFLLLLARSNRP